MFALDVHTRRILAQDRIDSLAASRRRDAAGRSETLTVSANRLRAAAVPHRTTAVRPHSNPA
jgi:hypothetical protein